MLDAVRVLIEARLTKLQDDIDFNVDCINNKQAQLADLEQINLKFTIERDQLIAVLAGADHGTI